jgi:hypothetical protein
MNGVIKAIMCIVLALCVVQIGAAYSVKSIEITPKGEPNTGDTVTVSTVINFASSGGVTFDSSNSLRFSSDLEDEAWSFVVSRDGISDPAFAPPFKKGQEWINVLGFQLSYKSGTVVALTATVQGKAPNLTSSSTITAMRIQEVDENMAVVSNGEYKKEMSISNPATLTLKIQQKEADLLALRKSLDEKIRLGIDTSEAETKYKAAQTAINSAKSAPTASAGNTYLTNAQTYITEATNLADKAWAQHDLSSAEQQVKEVDSQIKYFTVNRSMGSDSRVAVIVSKYEAASTSLSTAKNTFNQGNYIDARRQAGDTSNKAMEAYNLSTQLRADIGEGGLSLNFLGGIIPYIVGILVIGAIAAGGYFLYKKKFKWDELG